MTETKPPFMVILAVKYPDGKTYETIATLIEAIQLEKDSKVIVISVTVYDPQGAK